ncbi:MAG: LamG domain-containing protein [Myxococcales bacterium]|nr:LamG domain-containing protein [Myxococcales bacterium]
MRRGRWLLGLVLAACGLDVQGTLAPSGAGGGSPDGGAVPDAALPPGSDGGVGDASVDPLDAGPDAPVTRGRVTAGLVALYEMEEAAGSLAKDTSGVAPALDLVVPVDVTWQTGALRFSSPSRVGSGVAATKIYSRCVATKEITVESWFSYGALPDWSRIVVMGSSAGIANFAMTTDPTTIGFDLRTTTDLYQRDTMGVFGQIPSGVHHMVDVRTSAGKKLVYLDGALTITSDQGGDLATWNGLYELSIGNTPFNDRPFFGDVHLVAVYDRALSDAEVGQNFAAGADP